MVFFKTNQVNSLNFSRISYLVVLLIVVVFSIGCEKEIKSNSIICNLDDYSLYPKFIEQILPSYTIKEAENKAYYMVDDGAITEAFDTQAVGALQTGIAKYWYPQYLATVVIAIDRDRTDKTIAGWKDLFETQEVVGFSNTPVNNQMLVAAISYGLEGQDYTLKRAIKMLASLQDNSRLEINSFDAPIIICYDYQAAALIEAGGNIEILIPMEGTLTYEKGLLSNQKLVFPESTDKLLVESKLITLSGERDLSIYPDKKAYTPAVRVTNYQHFAEATNDVSPLMERSVLNVKRFMSIGYPEHLYFALLYMIIVTFWAASVLRRSMQKGISYAAFFTGVILIGWALVRLIKYQVVVSEVFSRYLWYSYYIFQLSLPLVILWMAWAIDKPINRIFPPKWWRLLIILIVGLIMLVFTNDLHGLVFQLDLNRADWDRDYTYGFGYYIILAVCMINISIGFAILVKKSIRSPRKKRFIFPFGIFILFGVYNYRYIMRDSFAYDTDLAIVTGIFVMLMFEACIRSGLIPVNTKYIEIFKGSPLKIQIFNKNKEMAIASALAQPIDKATIDKAIASSPSPILQEDESLIFANQIPGGYALWSEDVSKIQDLNREIQQSTKKLGEANAILAAEEKIQRTGNEKIAKRQLMDQLEAEITEKITCLSTMIEELEHSENHSMEITRLALLLCYIKRKCSLFFKEQEMRKTESDVLIMYIDELCEIAKYSNVQIVTVKEIEGDLPTRYTTLFYDFFYTVADLALQKECPYIIVDIGREDELISMRLLLSLDIGELKTELKLLEAIAKAKGEIIRKEIEDTIGISISFPKGGVIND